MASNRVCKILGITKPVVQAPLYWLTSPKFCAAVSNAGGLGVLGVCCGFKKPVNSVKDMVVEYRKSIQEMRRLTDKPFGFNAFPKAFDPYGFSKATIELCKEEGVKTIVFVGETSKEEIAKLKEDGFTVIVREINPSVRGAQKAVKAGADIIVATGCDEGGTMPRLSTGTFAQVALLKEAVKVPILAAGGIVNETMAKASAVVGAEGAFVGTRLILSEENPAALNVKQDILKTHPDDYIVYTIMNGLARYRTTPHKIGKDGFLANKKNDFDPTTGSFYEGLIKGNLDASVNSVSNLAPLIKSIDPCKKIVEEIAKGYM
ncbi:2-nitropropane dioxygenase-like enzyme [Neocallimastix californiae]|uniref:2-nitropropane dioxygenase-like enzyme n=1 Tax=Neocallimastix californiae TaxID=1754190 RepID=A0A1Y2DS28_9FUNG|nr:2-nitropropane dioxygenase-like enzyme [Neocallimastix californiae]|eukprot:ORY61979.1 2-nitropropane dioxygenase-like enzyme [Neocallimastix californiae]